MFAKTEIFFIEDYHLRDLKIYFFKNGVNVKGNFK